MTPNIVGISAKQPMLEKYLTKAKKDAMNVPFGDKVCYKRGRYTSI